MSINKVEHEASVEEILLGLGIHIHEILSRIKKRAEINYNNGGDSEFYYSHPVSRHSRAFLKEYTDEQIEQAIMEKLEKEKSVSVREIDFSRPNFIFKGEIRIAGNLKI